MGIAKLALEDGTVYTGQAFGHEGEADGEVVFNTSMTGYQEVLTDPSYHGQIVAMTYPEIGNYGVNAEDAESARPWVRGFVVRSLAPQYSNYRAQRSLADYLRDHQVVGIAGIDTRSLVKHIRDRGALRGVISATDPDDASLVAKALASPGLAGRDLTREVMTRTVARWEAPLHPLYRFAPAPESGALQETPPHVVALDYGMKWNIPRHLVDLGCAVTVMPGLATPGEILEQAPDGLFLSNGPGDPSALTEAVANLEVLIRDGADKKGIPIFGICLGHQLLGQAFGAATWKLKFGHRGANHPVRDLATGKVEITTQNHGYAVDSATLPPDVEATHVNLNDQTLEGLRHRRLPVFSVQYHPEASAGPHDSHYLFAEFRRAIDRHRG